MVWYSHMIRERRDKRHYRERHAPEDKRVHLISEFNIFSSYFLCNFIWYVKLQKGYFSRYISMNTTLFIFLDYKITLLLYMRKFVYVRVFLLLHAATAGRFWKENRDRLSVGVAHKLLLLLVVKNAKR